MSVTSAVPLLEHILLMTDGELAALAKAPPAPVSITLDEVLGNVAIDPEYAFLITRDNALLMGCLASIAKHRQSVGHLPARMVWDIVGAVLERQIRMLSAASADDYPGPPPGRVCPA